MPELYFGPTRCRPGRHLPADQGDGRTAVAAALSSAEEQPGVLADLKELADVPIKLPPPGAVSPLAQPFRCVRPGSWYMLERGLKATRSAWP